MGKLLLFIAFIMFFSNIALGMYGEDTAPSEKDKPYMRDKESPEEVTTPERKTTMPEPMQDIRSQQKDDPMEDYVEDNVKYK